MRWYHDYLRWLYRTGRPNLFARIQNWLSARPFAAGIMPRRVSALGSRGRRSGRLIWFPIVLTEFDGRRYVVSMLGANVNWVRNLTAAGGRAILQHGRAHGCHQRTVADVQLDSRPVTVRVRVRRLISAQKSQSATGGGRSVIRGQLNMK
ncbi:nitroreductase family deazaflavin-dependent oxidoreductase [Nocardia sp. CA-084685]|uniref:nitroreductase family deazaflavin-dependent oxidoreductase n=1 Tax=Nocardia sp. CA-084685 TaxID=3239970 RepID=UPI003D954CAE